MTEDIVDRSRRPGLGAIAAADGSIAVVALDQRNTLRRMLSAAGRPDGAIEMEAFKVDVVEALSPVASAVLLDPDFGVPAVARAGVLATGCGTVVAVEPADRDVFEGEPRARRDPERSAAWVAAMGGDAVKLLVQLRPDRPRRPGSPDLVAEVTEVVRAVVDDCAAAGIPSVVETLLYALPGEEPLCPKRRAELIVESARVLDDTGPDLLKLEYPGDASSCRAVAEVLSGPWALLSAGMAFSAFLEAVRTSTEEGGASGFIAGRSYWSEAVALDGAARKAFLATTARRRLEESIAALAGRARPWSEARRRPR